MYTKESFESAVGATIRDGLLPEMREQLGMAFLAKAVVIDVMVVQGSPANPIGPYYRVMNHR
jgi:hypothetical protein